MLKRKKKEIIHSFHLKEFDTSKETLISTYMYQKYGEYGTKSIMK